MFRHRHALACGLPMLLVATTLIAQDAGTPLTVTLGQPYGAAQTHSFVTDPQVDGNVLRVVVAAPTANPWEAGMNSPVGDRLQAGERVRATIYMRAAAGTPAATVQLAIQESAAPYIGFGEPVRVTLTNSFAPYSVEATIPRALRGKAASVTLWLGFAAQTVDVAAVQAVKLP